MNWQNMLHWSNWLVTNYADYRLRINYYWGGRWLRFDEILYFIYLISSKCIMFQNNFDMTFLFWWFSWNDKKGEMESFRNNNTRSLPVDRKGLCSNLPRMRLCYLSTKRVERGPLFESFITKVSSHTPSQNKAQLQLLKRVLQILNPSRV